MMNKENTDKNSPSLSHLYNLYQIATADKRFHKKERQLFKQYTQEHNISATKLRMVLAGVSKVPFWKPQTLSQKISLMHDHISMMRADGKIHSSESSLCRAYARKMGFCRHLTQPLIDQTVYLIQIGYHREEVTAKLIKWLSKQAN